MDIKKNKWVTKKIKVYGIVQGVGFRPYVYRLARFFHILGSVRNLGGQAEIVVQSSVQNFEAFLKALLENQDNGYQIIHYEVEDITGMKFFDFSIEESGDDDEISIISPDLPMCRKCEEEFMKQGNNRYQNPFITCMSCGPRYTIIEKLPYDRKNTTMGVFPMCDVCNDEYTSPDSRRFHAQTISCNDCGPYLVLGNLIENQALDKAVKILSEGGILAVKGIGGYHYACSPFKEEAVLNLRLLKGREEKPFAVMFPTLERIREYCMVSKEEKELLESDARPIVLLKKKGERMAPSVTKDSYNCGVFLPYTSLQMMLLERCGPLIMTSANLSGSPIIREDKEMQNVNSPLLNGVLYHKRKILRSVDDSVAKIVDGKPQFTRRSRGLVPYPIMLHGLDNTRQIFAAGSDLKASFCLYKKNNAVVSQYFGDLEEGKVFDTYEESVKDLCHLLNIHPDIALCDMHPNYFSSRYAENLQIPLIKVQHHHAHIASVMAEYNLNEPVIGVAFDGTGYGVDGNIWGSEFLICDKADFTRTGHLEYTPMIGGDSSMKDGKKTADCYLIQYGLEQYAKDDRISLIKAAVKNRINTVLSSSMGRLFDGVASILGIQDENTYEAQCAILLEKEATFAKDHNREPVPLSFNIKKNGEELLLDPKPIFEALCRLREEKDTGALALGFHFAVADAILRICTIIRKEQGIHTVALSGGVFQNTLLTERTIQVLREQDFMVYINRVVPPNDGCISLGQTYIGLMR